MSSHAAGWYADPFQRNEYRWWDGQRWTETVSNRGIQGFDMPEPAPTVAGPPAAPTPPAHSPPPYVAPSTVPGHATTAQPIAEPAVGPVTQGWRKFRSLPLWAQIASWVALVAVVGALGSTGKKDKDVVVGTGPKASTSVPTTAVPASTTDLPSTQPAPTTAAPAPTAPPTAPPTSPPPPPTTAAPARPTLTPSQQSAVRSAESYLEFRGFSRQGLIDQLSSEYGDQFSVADATFAVDSLDTDWNEQAVRAAQAYLDFRGFSCQGLIDQLSSAYGDQFTVDQARHGATQVGLC